MNKKFTSTVLAALMIAGTTSFTAFAAMTEGTVVIGSKAFDLSYANDTVNVEEITKEIVAGGTVYIKDFEGNWISNLTGLVVDTKVIPAVVYKNAIGVETNFAAEDKDGVNILADGINITSAGDVTSVVNGETLQMSAVVTPTDTTDKKIIWSVTAGTGTATIDTSGLLTATGVGTITVKASNTASGETKTMPITVSAVVAGGGISWGGGGSGGSETVTSETVDASTLQSAVSNSDITTITLNTDITDNIVFNRLVNLDLNGKTLTGSVTYNVGSQIKNITLGSGTVTGDLSVTAPGATVNNYSTVDGNVNINDISSSTWNENATGNNISFNDPDAGTNLVIAPGITVESLILNAPADVTLPAAAIISSLTIGAGATGTTIDLQEGAIIATATVNATGVEISGTGVITEPIVGQEIPIYTATTPTERDKAKADLADKVGEGVTATTVIPEANFTFSVASKTTTITIDDYYKGESISTLLNTGALVTLVGMEEVRGYKIGELEARSFYKADGSKESKLVIKSWIIADAVSALNLGIDSKLGDLKDQSFTINVKGLAGTVDFTDNYTFTFK